MTKQTIAVLAVLFILASCTTQTNTPKTNSNTNTPVKSPEFIEFESLFSLVDTFGFTIGMKEWNNYKPKEITQKQAEDFLNAKLVFDEDLECFNTTYTAIAKIIFPEKKVTGLIVHETVCPMPAVYDDFLLYVFDSSGKFTDLAELGFLRGGHGDSEKATSVFHDMKFTKTVTHEYIVDFNIGIEEKIETKHFEIILNPDGTISETPLEK